MFKEIKLTSIGIEATMADYLVKGDLLSRGDMLIYLNDRNWSFMPFQNAEIQPLANDRRVGAMKPATTIISKYNIEILSVISEEDAERIRTTTTMRPVLMVLGHFIVQGKIHVSSDAPDEDMLDDMHDFFPVTKASIIPIRTLASAPTEKVPLLFINRSAVQLYRVKESG